MKESISDIQLIEKIKTGDMSSFEMLVNRHKNFAFTIADRILQNEEDAEEVAHDAFVKLLTSIDKFKGESKFTTWFYRIVMNMAISRTRKKKIRTEDIDSSPEGIAEYSSFEEFGGLNANDRTFYLNKAVGQLKDEERLLITLYYFDELDMDELVEVTKIDKGNLKVKIFRARKKLAELLRKLLLTELESIL
ncbi:RNA polymerase sigma-70 factor, ECF subfamily [Reichenbachiella faecimaris]|uniref:RNA polymerase sigma-70 factor, ECF subfamily n=1 Tax=Reichenbachiella faecimaris TaxID=692418 RepID=A0A1W2GBF4_REIFA|nr:sigma-70 family RNA polymerase sigma factor [Reichenbachiella faecimaris]SMD33931.1 RNA polymerase sigma-70 factor, ECF subfamily [Reichenbachiella faecimaris]